MRLIIHRGTDQIGGSCVEFVTSTTRIIVDIGLPLDSKARNDEDLWKYMPSIEGKIDAVLISHYHMDHHGLLPILDETVPVYASEGTISMFGINVVFINQKPIKNLIKIESNKEITIGDIRITPYTVDHSAFDAMAFLIESEGKRILYSGDIRIHGVKARLYKFLPKEVDYLILEGTNIGKENYSADTEDQIMGRFTDVFKSSNDAINYVWCSGQNIDRLVSIYRACLQSSKFLVVDPYVANVLYEVHAIRSTIPSLSSHDNLYVYYPNKLSTKISNMGYNDYLYRLMPKKYKLTYEILSANPEKFVMIVRPSVLEFISMIEAPKGNFINSMYQLYETYDENRALINWVKEKGYTYHHIHTSGHATLQELKTITAEVNPKYIIPIHTENKNTYANHFDNIIVLNDNQPFTL